ncbi:MAG: large conductance mechanosensitive channel protein MscL [Oscillospiraceae bacterium]|nr:large conductance mechanosensitive channel protein MscL [Oscillospiraceae bacterium]MDD4547079.1 large conductance mechanosensitive channel protein MscL [Oscillospiraceae bacterium]
MLEEFKKFAIRGNVIDLAIGVIIGGAFQKIVTSAINDLVMPLVGMLTGSANFNDQYLALNIPEGVELSPNTTLAAAKELGVATLNYGAFITTITDFMIMAVIIFIMVKLINRMSDIRKKQEIIPAEPTTKECRYCLSEISIKATRCPHCTSEL